MNLTYLHVALIFWTAVFLLWAAVSHACGTHDETGNETGQTDTRMCEIVNGQPMCVEVME